MAASHTSFDRLEKICAKNPTSILFARLADGLLSMGQVKRATEVCRMGLRYRPSYVAGHVVMGKCHLSAGRLEEARQEFQKVLQLDADHLAALWQLGQIDEQLGWEDLALRHFSLAYQLDPFNGELAARIETLRGQCAKAAPEGDLAFDLEPPDEPVDAEEASPAPSGHIDPVPEAAVAETSDEALSTLVHALNASEETPQPERSEVVEPIATVTLAELYAGQGLIRQAIDVLERVRARNPQNAQVLARLEELRTAHASE